MSDPDVNHDNYLAMDPGQPAAELGQQQESHSLHSSPPLAALDTSGDLAKANPDGGIKIEDKIPSASEINPPIQESASIHQDNGFSTKSTLRQEIRAPESVTPFRVDTLLPDTQIYASQETSNPRNAPSKFDDLLPDTQRGSIIGSQDDHILNKYQHDRLSAAQLLLPEPSPSEPKAIPHIDPFLTGDQDERMDLDVPLQLQLLSGSKTAANSTMEFEENHNSSYKAAKFPTSDSSNDIVSSWQRDPFQTRTFDASFNRVNNDHLLPGTQRDFDTPQNYSITEDDSESSTELRNISNGPTIITTDDNPYVQPDSHQPILLMSPTDTPTSKPLIPDFENYILSEHHSHTKPSNLIPPKPTTSGDAKPSKRPVNQATVRERKRIIVNFNRPPSLTTSMRLWIQTTHALLDPFREDTECWLHPYPPRGHLSPRGILRPCGKLQKRFYWSDTNGRHSLVLNYGIVSKLVYHKMTAQQIDGFINKHWHLSHLCGNWTCVNPAHTTVESGAVNASRNGCFSHRSGCLHEAKCMKELKVPLGADGKLVDQNKEAGGYEILVDDGEDWSLQSFEDGEDSFVVDGEEDGADRSNEDEVMERDGVMGGDEGGDVLMEEVASSS